jgi:hypothetical protein
VLCGGKRAARYETRVRVTKQNDEIPVRCVKSILSGRCRSIAIGARTGWCGGTGQIGKYMVGGSMFALGDVMQQVQINMYVVQVPA